MSSSLPSTRKINMTRRSLIQAAAATSAAGLVPGRQSAIYAQGSDNPEKEEVRIGFIPLTDCASASATSSSTASSTWRMCSTA